MWNDGAVVCGTGERVEENREPGEARRRDLRAAAGEDAFGRILGDEWVPVEPGIYRLASDLQAEAERERRRAEAEAEALDASLLDAIPGRDEAAKPAPTQAPQESGRSWWRRR
jgi:hypothetical protein